MTQLTANYIQTCFTVVLLLLSTMVMANTDSIEVIPLKHRPADLLIPTLTSISKGSVDITAANNKLILRGDAAELAQLRALIDELDTPLAQYKIYVRQNKGHTDNERHSSASYRSKSESGNIKVGKTTLDGRPFENEGAKVVLGNSNQRLTSTVKTYSANSHRNTEQSVRAIEGYPARIEAGKEIPFLRYSHGDNHGHITQDYKPVVTGFYVTPWQSGNESVTLEISTQKQRLETNNHERLDQNSYGEIDTASYSSTVNAQLGEWINLGASLKRGNQKDRSVGNRYSIQSGDNYSFELKIERIGQ